MRRHGVHRSQEFGCHQESEKRVPHAACPWRGQVAKSGRPVQRVELDEAQLVGDLLILYREARAYSAAARCLGEGGLR